MMKSCFRSALVLTLAFTLGVEAAAQQRLSDWRAARQLKPGTPISLRVTGRTGQPRTAISADEDTLRVSNSGVTEPVSRDDVQEIAYDVTRRGSVPGALTGAAVGFGVGVVSVFFGRYSRGVWPIPVSFSRRSPALGTVR
jgi:hypothetical protein